MLSGATNWCQSEGGLVGTVPSNLCLGNAGQASPPAPRLPELTRGNLSCCLGRPRPGGWEVTHLLLRSGKTEGVCKHLQEPGALSPLSWRQAAGWGRGKALGGSSALATPLGHEGPSQAPPLPSGQASLRAICADLRIQVESKDFF